jgi:flavodoxin
VDRILVTYFSETGNTKKIAEAIFSALPEAKEIKPIDEVRDVKGYELVFIGFPVHSHTVPFRIEKFLRSLPRGKKIALFSTHGSLAGDSLSREAIESAAVAASQAKIVSTFTCRGKVSARVLAQLEGSPEHEAWTSLAVSASNHPNEDDIAAAQAFARWVHTLSHNEGA